MKTQVAIIGAVAAGLGFGHLLRQAGVDCVILERQTRACIESRIRPGVLQTVTTGLLPRLSIDAGLNVNGLQSDARACNLYVVPLQDGQMASFTIGSD